MERDHDGLAKRLNAGIDDADVLDTIDLDADAAGVCAI
jgi:hypothetical protein